MGATPGGRGQHVKLRQKSCKLVSILDFYFWFLRDHMSRNGIVSFVHSPDFF